MDQKSVSKLVLLAALAGGLSACTIRVRDRSTDPCDWCSSSMGARSSAGATRSAEEPSASRASGGGETAVELARRKLELARLSGEISLQAAESRLNGARADLAEAERALATTIALELPNALAAAELAVDRAVHAVEQKRLELQQMISTYERYGEEDYARMNQELVVGRERRALEFAERELLLARAKLELLRGHEQPARVRKLEEELDRKRRDLAAAELALVKARSEGALANLEAEEGLRKAEAAGAAAGG
jgi:hypothetical protein